MNRLLLAMSVLKNTENISSFEFEVRNNKIIEGCYSQLEPVPVYMLSEIEGGLEIIVLASKETRYSLVGEERVTACSFFMRRVLLRSSQNANLDDIPTYIELGKLYDYGDVRFYFIDINENSPKVGMEEAVEYIKNNPIDACDEFWIDTHGGFRDISLSMCSVVSLLKVYDVYPKEIVGVRFGDGNKINRVVNQRESFSMFEFVSGMNEFISFGSADTLSGLLGNVQNESIQKLVMAMKKISDGTKLCDPKTYVAGLKDMRAIIDNVRSDDQMITVFIDYIKKDYGVLLTGNWNAIDIVERCCRKKMYQQAMTFAESMMPELFVKNKVLYCNPAATETICNIKKSVNKDYVTVENYIFDSVIFDYKYVRPSVNDWESLSNGEKASYGGKNGRKDYESIKALDEWSNQLIDGFIGVSGCSDYATSQLIKIKNKGVEVGYFEVFTDIVNDADKRKTGRLLRLHKAIKNCRNLINHAADKPHPSIPAIEKAMTTYIALARELFACEMDHRCKASNYKDAYGINDAPKKTDNNKGEKNKKNKAVEKTVDKQEEVLTINEIGRVKKTLRGVLADGSKGVIPASYSKGLDLNSYMGKTITVYVGTKNGEFYNCEPKSKL